MNSGMRGTVGLPPVSLYLRLVKPALDFVLVLVTLPMTLPAILLIALVVRLTSPGPVFLRLTCYGRDGRTFGQLRFRVVHIDAASRQFRAQAGGAARGTGDPRLTRVGRFLLRTQLNTLPQIFNVLVGQMSLVGPAAEPEAAPGTDRTLRAIILRVRPGLFSPDDLAGVTPMSDEDRRAVALAYAAKASFLTDLGVLFAVFREFLGHRAN